MMLEKVIISISGFSSFVVYFCTCAIFTFIFSFIYDKITPYKELELISKGNIAASCSFSGAILGFIIPLASAVMHSAGLIDMIIWGAIALFVQILTFFVVKKIFPAINIDIPAGQLSTGLFLGIISIAIGILNAACITG